MPKPPFISATCRHARRSLLVTVSIVLSLAASTTSALADSANDTLRQRFLRPDHIRFPTSAPYSPQIATLGKMLFFDTRLSKAQNMSCSSCHNPSFGWETPVDKAIGAMNVSLSRHAPTVINLSEATEFYWDGRAPTLEAQARGPITNPLEMDMPLPDLVNRLRDIRGYRRWFTELFPGEGITEANILQSLATFERTLESGWAPFDDWIAGDEGAISPDAVRGFELFTGKAGCIACHDGWAFTDRQFHDIGLDTLDLGRFAIDSSATRNRYAFKTPTLRNIHLRAPYMHNGELASLDEVLEHYTSGGISRPSRAARLVSITLSQTERVELIEFLGTLTERRLDVSTPVLPAR